MKPIVIYFVLTVALAVSASLNIRTFRRSAQPNDVNEASRPITESERITPAEEQELARLRNELSVLREEVRTMTAAQASPAVPQPSEAPVAAPAVLAPPENPVPLVSDVASRPQGAGSPFEGASLPDAAGGDPQARHVMLAICAAQLQQIGMAAKRWVADSSSPVLPDIRQLHGYISPMILSCPSQPFTKRPNTLEWSKLKEEKISYRCRVRESAGTYQDYVTCPTHDHALWSNGQVRARALLHDSALGGLVEP
jgi:hypothetical protein